MSFDFSVENTGLIIVDMQIEGCERHGPTVKPVIQNIRRLLDRFRAANGKIIHVQSVRTKDHPEFTVFGKEYSLLENSPGAAFVEELQPLPHEVVVKNILMTASTKLPWKRYSGNSICFPAATGWW